MRVKVATEFNKILRAHLKSEGMTQKMLAEFSGVTITTLGGWVSGGFSPSLTGVCMIAKVLRVTLDDLIPPERMILRYKLSTEYSDALGARYISQSKFSGEDFRNSVLAKLYVQAKQEGKVIQFDLDGTYGFPPSFLEEAFGGLARLFPKEKVHEKFVFVCNDEPSVVDEIICYMKKAYTGEK